MKKEFKSLYPSVTLEILGERIFRGNTEEGITFKIDDDGLDLEVKFSLEQIEEIIDYLKECVTEIRKLKNKI